MRKPQLRSLIVAPAMMLLAGCEFYSVVPRPLVTGAAQYTVVDSAMIMASDKTIVDHLYSYQQGKDCSTVRVEQGRTYCLEDEPNPEATVHCYHTLGDITCYKKVDGGQGQHTEVATPYSPTKTK